MCTLTKIYYWVHVQYSQQESYGSHCGIRVPGMMKVPLLPHDFTKENEGAEETDAITSRLIHPNVISGILPLHIFLLVKACYISENEFKL